MKYLTSLAVILGVAMSLEAKATILPENNLDLEDDVKRVANLTEADFNEIIDKVIDTYQSTVKAHGATLKCNKKWTSSTVNASANQMFGTWYVNMYGGLARRDEVTKDGFALVVCHELGHHLGGFPFTQGWAADEGQADYFATLACARKIWENEFDENEAAEAMVDPTAQAECDNVWNNRSDRQLCYRTSMGGLSLATLLAALGESKAPKFDTPDTSKVSSTNHAHPAAQCRLDTYFAGAICDAKFAEDVIPGKDNPSGEDSADAEKEAAKYSCMKANGDKIGLRPACWFAERK
jgi:hypothetical protein